MKAYSICLTFDGVTTHRLVHLNSLLEIEHQPIDFSSWALPHLTLAQVLMTEEERLYVQDHIDALSSIPDHLHHHGCSVMTSKRSGNQYMYLDIDVSGELQTCHEDVMDIIQPYVWREVLDEHFLFPELMTTSWRERVQFFYTAHAYENYHPHITMWKGVFPLWIDVSLESPLFVDRIIIGRLGNNGTVRELYKKE